MPAKTAAKNAAKQPAKKRRSRKATSTDELGLRGAALTRARDAAIEVGVEGPVPQPVPLGLSIEGVRAALRRRDPLALCKHPTNEHLAVALLDAASDPENKRWADVLTQAEVPWLAWIALREQSPAEATTLFRVWASRVADDAAIGTVEIAGELQGSISSEDVAAARVKIGARTWIAERLDPEVYGKRQISDTRVQASGNVTIVFKDEIGE